jgi:hypothetical protein
MIQGVQYSTQVETGTQADELLGYVYDTRDVVVLQWFTSDRRARLLAQALDRQRREVMCARRRLDAVWAAARVVRRAVEDSGLTDVSRTLAGRDLIETSEFPPNEIGYIYHDKSKTWMLHCPC